MVDIDYLEEKIVLMFCGESKTCCSRVHAQGGRLPTKM